MPLGLYALFEFEMHLLISSQIALSKYERVNVAKNVIDF